MKSTFGENIMRPRTVELDEFRTSNLPRFVALRWLAKRADSEMKKVLKAERDRVETFARENRLGFVKLTGDETMKTTDRVRERQEAFRVAVTTDLHRLVELRVSQGTPLTEIASRCGVTVTGLRAKLYGKKNLTLRSVGRLLAAIDHTARLEIAPSRALTAERIATIKATPAAPAPGDVHRLIAMAHLPKVPRPDGRTNFRDTTVKTALHGIASTGFEWVGIRDLVKRTGVTMTLLCPMLQALETAGLIETGKREQTGVPMGSGLRRHRVRMEKLRLLVPTDATRGTETRRTA